MHDTRACLEIPCCVLCIFAIVFYSASALLAKQTAVIARAILSVCLSVHLFVHHVRLDKTRQRDTIVLFSASGRKIILVSGEVKFIRIFVRNHPQRGR